MRASGERSPFFERWAWLRVPLASTPWVVSSSRCALAVRGLGLAALRSTSWGSFSLRSTLLRSTSWGSFSLRSTSWGSFSLRSTSWGSFSLRSTSRGLVLAALDLALAALDLVGWVGLVGRHDHPLYGPHSNGWKASITLEELGLPYQVRALDLGRWSKGAVVLELNPNGRIPVDRRPRRRRLCGLRVGGDLMIYLAERTGQLLPSDAKARLGGRAVADVPDGRGRADDGPGQRVLPLLP
jgi:hypothetical protein